jgi:hypothetical protein
VQAKVGKGILIACAPALTGEENFTGAYLLSQLADYATNKACEPRANMTSAELLELVASARAGA